jgi:hypothetical protein
MVRGGRKVPFFVALGNCEHACQYLDRTSGVAVAFQRKGARMQALIERPIKATAAWRIHADGRKRIAHVSQSDLGCRL